MPRKVPRRYARKHHQVLSVVEGKTVSGSLALLRIMTSQWRNDGWMPTTSTAEIDCGTRKHYAYLKSLLAHQQPQRVEAWCRIRVRD
ncbi:hypothetical protein NEH40_16290, partial [Xanthomonas hortorum pv. pelargonii]